MYEDHKKWTLVLSITNMRNIKSPGMDIKSKKGTKEVCLKNEKKFKNWFRPQIIVV